MGQSRPEHTQKLFRSSFPPAEMEDFRTSSWIDGLPQAPEDLKPLFPSIPHALVSAAALGGNSGITVVCEDDGESESHHSYDQLLHKVKHVAGRLTREGVRPGDRVMLVLPTSFEFVITFCAVQIIGAIPVPVYPPLVLERAEPALKRMALIANHAKISWCMTTSKLTLLIGDLTLRTPSLNVITTIEGLLHPGPVASFHADPSTNDPALIQYTSGSTGHPKGVLLTHANLVANVHAIGQSMQINRHDRVASWLPLYHDMGLIGCLLLSIYWRIPLVLLSPLTFLTQPASWLWAIHRHRSTLSAAPNFAYGRCAQRVRSRDIEGLNLSCWRVAFNGAEPVNVRTVRDFQKRFAAYGFNSEAVLPVYGLAENTLAATFPTVNESLHYQVVDRAALADGTVREAQGRGSIAIVSVGRAMPGHTVLVVNSDGQPLPDRDVGHIITKGPSVMKGYFRDPAATAEAVDRGWLWTGDLGYVSDGRLYVTGRVKDLIILRGRNYYAEDIERQVERVPGVRAGAVVAFSVYDDQAAMDQIVIVFETRVDNPTEQQQLKIAVGDRVNEFCGVPVHESMAVPPGTIPKTPSGKRQRALCRQWYQHGQLHPRTSSSVGVSRAVATSLIGIGKSRLNRLLGRKRSGTQDRWP